METRIYVLVTGGHGKVGQPSAGNRYLRRKGPSRSRRRWCETSKSSVDRRFGWFQTRRKRCIWTHRAVKAARWRVVAKRSISFPNRAAGRSCGKKTGPASDPDPPRAGPEYTRSSASRLSKGVHQDAPPTTPRQQCNHRAVHSARSGLRYVFLRSENYFMKKTCSAGRVRSFGEGKL